MDRTHALAAFWDYVGAYDPSSPRIALKVDHTLRVASLCQRIARAHGLDAESVDLAWLAGLLHDIGRFEQVRRYDTFNDAASVDHAALGAQLLFEAADGAPPLVRRFVEDDRHDAQLACAVAHHSAYRLPTGLDTDTATLCNILRDADKIDILKVNCDCSVEVIYGVTEAAMRASEVSEACVRIFYEHRCLPRGVRQHPADIMLGHICFAWELVFAESLRIVREQGYLRRMLATEWELPATQAAFAQMAGHMEQELGI